LVDDSRVVIAEEVVDVVAVVGQRVAKSVGVVVISCCNK